MPRHHYPVTPYGRTRLCFGRSKFMHLAGRFIYQRQHHLEGYTHLLEHAGTQGLAVVDKVAGKDRRQMQVLASLAIQLIDLGSKAVGQFL